MPEAVEQADELVAATEQRVSGALDAAQARLARRELAAMDQRNNVKMNGGREGPSVASANNRAASVAAVLKSGTIAQRSVTFANAQATQNQGSNNSKKR